MTDEAKALVERLRSGRWLGETTCGPAADLIETQARENAAKDAEIERLRGALKRWQYSGCPDCGGDCGSANPPVMCCIMEETRAALAGDSHDQ